MGSFGGPFFGGGLTFCILGHKGSHRLWRRNGGGSLWNGFGICNGSSIIIAGTLLCGSLVGDIAGVSKGGKKGLFSFCSIFIAGADLYFHTGVKLLKREKNRKVNWQKRGAGEKQKKDRLWELSMEWSGVDEEW